MQLPVLHIDIAGGNMLAHALPDPESEGTKQPEVLLRIEELEMMEGSDSEEYRAACGPYHLNPGHWEVPDK